ncbi:MAG TPA: peptidyl-prolyl cis-trans isomerase [Stellaceae bacterium]|jgi:peptidyl-prolyl cis-trans isomerase D|nr:peptidyl-prolyl cis-trans isomerase [Stellaceae bacterium]
MLQAIRTKAGGIVVKTLFGLLILSFGFWGLYTRSPYFQDNKSPETEVATVGDKTINVGEVQQALEPALERLRQQLGSSIDRDQVKQLGILDTLVNGLVDRALLDQEVARLKLAVADEVIRGAIAGNPAFRDTNGQFDPNILAQVLSMNHLTQEQFVARMQDEVPRTDILHAITSGVVPPRDVVNTAYRYANEKRVADIVSLPLSGAAAPPAPSDADLSKYYDAHQDNFRAPEYRAFTMASLSAADLAATIQIPDDKLKSEYDQRKDDLAVPEQREVEQILAPSEDVAKQADDALAAGKDWKEVATTIAKQDPDTIDLGLMKQSEMPEELAGPAFDLQVNQTSKPIQSPLGWHILRVTKIVPATTQSFEQAKPALTAALAKEEALDKLDKIGNKADDALAGGANITDIAQKFGLKVTKVEAADVGGRAPDGKAVELPVGGADALKTLFQTDQGDTSRVIDAEDGSIYAIHTDKVIAPRVKPLAEVKDQVIAGWQQEQKHDAVAKEAKDLAAAVAPDKPLKAAAADKKLAVTTSPPLSRRAQGDTGVPPAIVAKLFAAKKGDTVSADDDNGAYVAQLQDIQDPGVPSDPAAAPLSNQLAQGIRLDLAAEFTAALRSRYPVKIDHEALDKAF